MVDHDSNSANGNSAPVNANKWYDTFIPTLFILASPIGIFIAAITGLDLIAANPPPQMNWLPTAVLPLAILFTIIISSIIFGVYIITKRKVQTAGVFTFTTAFIASVLVGCYFLTIILPITPIIEGSSVTVEPILATRAELEQLRRDLLERQLSDSQANQILEIVIQYLTEQDYMTNDTAQNFVDANELNERLRNAGFNEIQREEIRKYFSESGFLTEPEVINIIREEQTRTVQEQVNLQATQEAETCYITPKSIYTNVAIRPVPSEENNTPVGYLYLNERIQVIGHNTRNVALAKWWLVSLDRGARTEQGWILSSVVDEINPIGCARIQPIPGT